MSWVCSNGHVNDDDSRTSCSVLSCTGYRPAAPGTSAAAWFSWLVALFSGPIYPVAGLLSWAAMAAVSGGRMPGALETGRGLAMMLAGLLVFWKTLPLEGRAGQNSAYRKFRDAFRVVALVAGIVWLGAHMEEYGLPPSEVVGLSLAAPFVFFGLRRMDRALDVGVSDRSWSGPSWLSAFVEYSNWRSAIVLGFGGGLLGFALGRGAHVLSGLVLWILTTLTIMAFSGGLAALAGHGRSVGKVLLGAIVGGMIGNTFSVVGMLFGAAVGGYLVGRRGGIGRKSRRSVYD